MDHFPPTNNEHKRSKGLYSEDVSNVTTMSNKLKNNTEKWKAKPNFTDSMVVLSLRNSKILPQAKWSRSISSSVLVMAFVVIGKR